MTKVTVLEALRQSREYEDNEDWCLVYLDNAKAKVPELSHNQFRGQLSALAKQGLYKVQDGYAWGVVKLKD